MATTADVSQKKTPFYEFHVKEGAKIVPFGGFLMPIQYAGMTAEHLAVRENVGLFDLSHMGEIKISGKGALEFLQRVTTNNVALLTEGKIQYSCMTTETGGIVDDLLVYCSGDSYLLVVNASNIAKDFRWLQSHQKEGVKIENVSETYGLLAVQGPQAEKVVKQLVDVDLKSMLYYTFVVTAIDGVQVLLSRTGYTGEDGFEIYIPKTGAAKVWKAVVAAGKESDMTMVGLGARDTLRLEMKMALYGNDIDETTTPIEAGLGWIVDTNKEFVGSSIISRQKEEKPARKLVCLVMDGKVIPRTGYDILVDDKPVGRVTSGAFSPSLKRPIALGYVPISFSKLGSVVHIAVRGTNFPAAVVKAPFYLGGSHK